MTTMQLIISHALAVGLGMVIGFCVICLFACSSYDKGFKDGLAQNLNKLTQ